MTLSGLKGALDQYIIIINQSLFWLCCNSSHCSGYNSSQCNSSRCSAYGYNSSQCNSSHCSDYGCN